MTWSASPESRLLRLAPPSTRSPRPDGVPPLDLRAVGRRRTGHERARLLLDPAERRDVVVGAQQQARLRGAGLRREVGLPLRQAVRALGQPARHLGGVAVAHGALEHGQRQTVDLQVEDAGHVGDHAVARTGGRCAGSRAACTCRRRWCRAGPRATTVTAATTRAAASAAQNESTSNELSERSDGQLEDPGVEKQDEDEAGDQHERQAQRRDERRQKRVEQRDEGRRDERPDRRPRRARPGTSTRPRTRPAPPSTHATQEPAEPQARPRRLPRGRHPVLVSGASRHPDPPRRRLRGPDDCTGGADGPGGRTARSLRRRRGGFNECAAQARGSESLSDGVARTQARVASTWLKVKRWTPADAEAGRVQPRGHGRASGVGVEAPRLRMSAATWRPCLTRYRTEAPTPVCSEISASLRRSTTPGSRRRPAGARRPRASPRSTPRARSASKQICVAT